MLAFSGSGHFFIENNYFRSFGLHISKKSSNFAVRFENNLSFTSKSSQNIF